MLPALAIILLCYLLGSIPFGLLAGKIKGIDPRHHGSGNIGATNVFRVLGKGWGIGVFLCDTAKGLLAVLLAGYIVYHFPASLGDATVPRTGPAFSPLGAAILGGIWAIMGHTFPVWLRFKGGKGVATSLGVIIALVPFAAAISFGVWVVVVLITRYVSLASIAAAISVPVTVGLEANRPDKWPLFALCAVAAFLIVWRHRSNIQRLLQGTEHRFGKPKQS